MAIKVGINGFGRIGRNIMRAAMDDSEHRFRRGQRSDRTPTTLAHLLKYDSILGNLKADITAKGDRITVDERRVPGAVGEGSGAAAVEGPRRRRRVRVDRASSPIATSAAKHIAAGAKKVIITAPAKKPDLTRRPRRQRGQVRSGEAPHHLERVVHDELPGAGRQGAARDASASARAG